MTSIMIQLIDSNAWKTNCTRKLTQNESQCVVSSSSSSTWSMHADILTVPELSSNAETNFWSQLSFEAKYFLKESLGTQVILKFYNLMRLLETFQDQTDHNFGLIRTKNTETTVLSLVQRRLNQDYMRQYETLKDWILSQFLWVSSRFFGSYLGYLNKAFSLLGLISDTTHVLNT